MFNLKSGMSDNAMVSVYPFGDEVYALSDMPFIHKLDLNTLETLDRVDVGENIGIVNHTSHPHVMDDCKFLKTLSIALGGIKYLS